MRLLLALLLLAPGMAWGQVLSCDAPWGGPIGSCGGCSSLRLTQPAADTIVRAGPWGDWGSTWTRFADVPAASLLATVPGGALGPLAACPASPVMVAKSSLGAPPPPPPPPPPPLPEPPPTSGATGTGEITWGAATRNVDGSAIRPPVTYRVTVSGCAARVIEPAVSPLTIAGLPAGTCFATIATRSADGYSDEVGPVSWVVAAAPPPPPPLPPPPPPPAGPVVVAVVPGLSHSPVFGITSTNGRGSTVLGFVPVGRACTGAVVYTYRGLGYRRVASSDVAWWGSTPTTAAAVACQ